MGYYNIVGHIRTLLIDHGDVAGMYQAVCIQHASQAKRIRAVVVLNGIVAGRREFKEIRCFANDFVGTTALMP